MIRSVSTQNKTYKIMFISPWVAYRDTLSPENAELLTALADRAELIKPEDLTREGILIEAPRLRTFLSQDDADIAVREIALVDGAANFADRYIAVPSDEADIASSPSSAALASQPAVRLQGGARGVKGEGPVATVSAGSGGAGGIDLRKLREAVRDDLRKRGTIIEIADEHLFMALEWMKQHAYYRAVKPGARDFNRLQLYLEMALAESRVGYLTPATAEALRLVRDHMRKLRIGSGSDRSADGKEVVAKREGPWAWLDSSMDVDPIVIRSGRTFGDIFSNPALARFDRFDPASSASAERAGISVRTGGVKNSPLPGGEGVGGRVQDQAIIESEGEPTDESIGKVDGKSGEGTEVVEGALSDQAPSERSFLLTGGAVFRPMVAGTLAPSVMFSRSAVTLVLAR